MPPSTPPRIRTENLRVLNPAPLPVGLEGQNPDNEDRKKQSYQPADKSAFPVELAPELFDHSSSIQSCGPKKDHSSWTSCLDRSFSTRVWRSMRQSSQIQMTRRGAEVTGSQTRLP